MSWRHIALRDVAPPLTSKTAFAPNAIVWHLSLDQIEPQTGRIIEKRRAPASEAGASTFAFDTSHVLYSKLRPYLNKVVRPNEPGLATTELMPLRPVEGVLEPDYLAYYLRSPTFVAYASQYVAGAKMPRIISKMLWEHCVPVPPPSEQRRIVELLDAAERLRCLRAEADLQLRRVLATVFDRIVGDPETNPHAWPLVAIDTVSHVQGGLQVTSARADRALTAPYLRVANVYRDRLELSEIKEMGVSEAELARTALAPEDVLIVEGHGNPGEIGRAAVWDGSITPCLHQNHLIRVRVDRRRLEPRYLSNWLNTTGGRRQLIQAGKTTSGLNTISVRNVKAVVLPLPPLEVQERYVAVSGRLLRSCADAARVEGDLECIFMNLLSRAFSGALTARWREAHVKDLSREMEQQAKFLRAAAAEPVPS